MTTKKSDTVGVKISTTIAISFSFAFRARVSLLRILCSWETDIEAVKHTLEAVRHCRRPREDIALNGSQIASKIGPSKKFDYALRGMQCNCVGEWK